MDYFNGYWKSDAGPLEVTNFKKFKETFIFDLAQTKSYEFNGGAVHDGVVNKGIIYGANGCGQIQSRLGHF